MMHLSRSARQGEKVPISNLATHTACEQTAIITRWHLSSRPRPEQGCRDGSVDVILRCSVL